MSRIKPVTLKEFIYLLEYAQEHHENHNEPIPKMHDSQYGSISSCLNTPFQTFGGKLLYKGFFSKAAILFYLLNKNHPLSNGNKRMACITLGWFCHKNRYHFDFPPVQFYNIAKEVTNSQPDEMEVILYALQKTISKFSHR